MVSARPTIVAIATPAGSGERALVRLSGSRAKEFLRALIVGPRASDEFAGRGLSDLRVFDGRGEQPARIVWMTAPRSYTGEDVVELHVRGSPPLVHALLARLQDLGAAPAGPGEFTRRAFENGRLSLDQAEGVLALIEARNDEAARAARELLFGGFGDEQARVRDQLADVAALGVASLDFGDDETGHVPVDELIEGAERVLAGIERLKSERGRRATERGLARAVLVGAPNAGKSSLFNRLAGGRALVSPRAGTTRDPLRAELVVAGSRVELIDTPGLEAGVGEVGGAAQALAEEARRRAALLVWVVDATRAEAATLQRERASLGSSTSVLLVWNKVDLAAAQPPPAAATLDVVGTVSASAVAGTAIPELAREIVARAAATEDGFAREIVERHRAALERATGELGLALARLRAKAPLDLAVEHLREALDALDDLAGRSAPEALLTRIFARFCIGK